MFQINSDYNGFEADQSIDIILGDFQVLKYFSIDDIEGYMDNLNGSKLDLALRNKFVKYETDDWWSENKWNNAIFGRINYLNS